MKTCLRFFLYVALSFGSSNANALDGVSRACRFSNLSASFGVQEVAARFFYAIGAPQSVLGLPDASLEEKKKWWVLESLTVDAARARYYLYATSVVYGFAANIYSPDYNKYVALHARSSPDWTAETIADQMKADPYFAPYYANRGVLFSARGGVPEIVENRSAWDSTYGGYRVRGYHWFYDPVTKATGELAPTVAEDCNLQSWGLGMGLFNR